MNLKILGGEKFIEIHPLFKKIAQKYNLNSSNLMEKIAEEGTLQVIEEIPENLKKIFVCAHDIIPEWHIKMQAAFQKYTDNAVSKTVNFKEESAREEVKEVFLLAYRENCKGVTIYRHGSRQKQVLNVGNGEKKEIPKEEKNIKLTLEQASQKEENNSHLLKSSFPPGKAFLGITERIPICNNNLYITVNYDESKISEVLIKTKSKEGCNIQLEILGRLINLAIKEGIEVNLILRELRDIKCPDCLEDSKIPIVPCTDGIIKVLERALTKKESFIHLASTSQKNSLLKSKISAFCPECKGIVEYAEGCSLCRNCGYSKCG
ncbi:MAG: hypothetical protein HYU63_00585 [Armatimonadetes bacterium]|nr:hypothetical protein [Armatimonadota bacterium]